MANTASLLATAQSVIAGAWISPASILVKNDSVAYFTTTTKNDTRTIEAKTFDFNSAIPSIATITQVDFSIRENSSTGGKNNATLYVSGVAGTSHDVNNTSLTTTDFGNEARPGGGGWTRNDLLNGTFTIRLTGIQPNNTTSRTYSFAWVTATAYYTTPPSVLSSIVSSITSSDAIGGGNVSSDGDSTILERGFTWNTSGSPRTNVDSYATTAGTTGAYQSSITGLSPATSYFAAAYAINANGSTYGTDISFSTSPAAGGQPDPFQSYVGAFSVIPPQYRNIRY